MARKTVKVLEKKFNEMIASHKMNELSFYIQLRSLYQTGVIYKYKLDKISQLTGVPRETVRRHLKVLKHHKLITNRDGNLCCIGLRAQRKSFKGGSIAITVQVVGRDLQMEYLQLAMLDLNFKRQEHAIAKRKKVGNFKGAKGQETDGIMEDFNLRNDYVGLSLRGFGQEFNRKPRTGQRIKKNLQQKGLIKCVHQYNVLCKNGSPQILAKYRNFLPERSGQIYLSSTTKEIRYTITDKISLSHQFIIPLL